MRWLAVGLLFSFPDLSPEVASGLTSFSPVGAHCQASVPIQHERAARGPSKTKGHQHHRPSKGIRA